MADQIEPSRDMIERARAAIDRAAQTENAETIIQFFAAEFTSVRSQAIELCAGVADKKAAESHRCMEMRKQACELQDAMAYSMDESVAKEVAACIRSLR